MKRKYLYLICLIVFIVMVTIILVLTKDKEEPKPIVTDYVIHKDFILVDHGVDGMSEDNLEEKSKMHVITSYEEYAQLFSSDVIKEDDFKDNNYFLLHLQYSGCNEYDVFPTDYEIKDDTVNITIKYKRKCGLCAPEHDFYLLKVDKKITNLKSNLDYILVSSEECDNDVVYKPLVYLYPEKEIDVYIKLANADKITTSYPKYINGWNVKAYPDGRLIDTNTNRELYGLYWEGKNYHSKVTDEGFIVKGEDTISFLEEKLSILGLTERESNEFIIYWLPKLENNKYNYIRFESIEEINKYMPLEITPRPDTLIRVYMVYKPLDEYIDVKEPKLNTLVRTGFTVVEWGGAKITN